MDEIDRIVEEILGSRRVRESATFSSRSYGSQPIIQTGKQYRESLRKREAAQPTPIPNPSAPRRVAPQRPAPAQKPPVPGRYYELQKLTQSQGSMGSTSMQGMIAYGSRAASRLFYDQARLMEDFEDDYPFEGTFFQYFPTYSSMSLSQLRGYFSWRTRVRAGEVGPAPTSFAFLYVYELLSGIGTTPGPKGYQDLKAFREAFRDVIEGSASSFVNYTRLWLRDYVVYHGLDTALARGMVDDLPLAVHTLLRAEKAALVAVGLERRMESRSPVSSVAPDDDELFAALDRCARYQIGSSRLRREHEEDLHAICATVFRALCVHCGRRRKTDYVEGLFGGPYDEFYSMFASAIFYDPEPHPDATVELSPVESYVCKDGRWRHRLLCNATAQSRELGSVLRAADQRLRDALDFAYPLKERPVQAYVGKIIDTAIADLLERRRQEEARRITIDLSRLDGIRAAAATTQEALLTDEERGEIPATDPVPDPAAADLAEKGASPFRKTEEGYASSPADMAVLRKGDAPFSARSEGRIDASTVSSDGGVIEGEDESSASGAATRLGLADAERRVLDALLAGTDPASVLTPADPMLSLVVDAINDKFFDLVGDAVVEYEEDQPVLIEDYLPDVKEALGL